MQSTPKPSDLKPLFSFEEKRDLCALTGHAPTYRDVRHTADTIKLIYRCFCGKVQEHEPQEAA